jgi:hypothetical protein
LELAKELQVDSLPIDQNGGVQLQVGENTTVVIYSQNDSSLLIVVPIAPLPTHPDFGIMARLLRLNLFDSRLSPFTLATDTNATVVLWGRVEIESITAASLAGLIDSLATETELIRSEIESGNG